ncbi:MAG: mannose-1-phosphate guanylyltransferase/mannose-6-phosphate isomerase [Nitrososphaerota archaeon]|jgi:mannose-1-phosphate guanylyltransferase/mannose-6-phosphate isomerase|nr:mannose-1-phosphate guanylyltransferase/mannose-6-phosphate isomerase [Nitrososphaerota archaeon]MDG6931134.1 mannose-1-phosphate guanylyltransferase/mannose-6-phosphate isomerase [Nitrososphaerota archaeon]
MKVVILAGGRGTRLWPMSRDDFPKQFLPLFDGESLAQRAVNLFSRLSEVHVVTSSFLAPYFNYAVTGVKSVITEPAPRGTAAAIALAVSKMGDEDLLFVPSDHVLGEDFLDAVKGAKPGHGEIVLFGHTPESPSTAYGYIKVNDEGKVLSFHEKPDAGTARKYLESGRYLWNMGMFMMKGSTGREAIREHLPDVYRVVFENEGKGYEKLEEVTFDYGVLEKHRKLSAVRYSGKWRDVGSWKSLYQAMEKDGNGNAVKGDAMAIDAKDSLVIANDRFVAAYGVSGMTIVSTRDAVLVMPTEESERTKEIVKMLGARKVAHESPTVYRPWGYFTVLEEGERYKVKKLWVSPGKSLSYQMHFHRAEHWIVVKGTARVTYDGEEKLIAENEGFYVPKGRKHRIENPGKVPLEIIEVQTGEYLGEDDIVRF